MKQAELATCIAQQIKQGVADNDENGFYREPLVGFSSADDPLYTGIKETVGDFHLYPQDILPEVKTVISFFIPFSQKVVQANRAVWPEVAKKWVLSYHDCNSLINKISEQLAQSLREKGYAAGTVVSTGSFDTERMVASWSHRSAAYIAGLGSFGLNRLLITEKGCAGRYGTVFASAEIAPTPRTGKEYCLYKTKGTCRYCVEKCPIHALSLDSQKDMQRRPCMEQCEIPSEYRGGLGAECCGKCGVGPCAYWA